MKPNGVFCPKCGNEMDPVNRSSGDKILSNLFFGTFVINRYVCFGCFWEQRVTSMANVKPGIKHENSAHHYHRPDQYVTS